MICVCIFVQVYEGRKANIQDITNPLNVIPLDGNATLQVKMTDMGEPGSSDKIAITVWNKDGGTWFSSNWNGTSTIEQVLGGGNLKVHGGAVCAVSGIQSTLITENALPARSPIVLEALSRIKSTAFIDNSLAIGAVLGYILVNKS